MNDLRTDLIEAGAEVAYTQRHGPSMSGPHPTSKDYETAHAMLDRWLDLLTKRAGELVRLADPNLASVLVAEARQVVIEDALAVLRNPREQ